MNSRIRKLTVNDLSELRKISVQTFAETFASVNTAENMTGYINRSFSEKKLYEELSNPFSHFFFYADGDAVLGYIKLNIESAQTDLQNEHGLEVERIYVLQNHQRKNIGLELLLKAYEFAREKGKAFVWLGVWEHNVKAIRFYEKNGFQTFGKHDFMLGDDRQTDLIMKKFLD